MQRRRRRRGTFLFYYWPSIFFDEPGSSSPDPYRKDPEMARFLPSDHRPVKVEKKRRSTVAKKKKTLEMIHHCRLLKKERARIYGTLAR